MIRRHQEIMEERIKKGRWAFKHLIFPPIASIIGGGQIIATEGDDHPLCKKLDYAGVDWFQISGNRLFRGIASRIQHTKFFSTTTVRLPHEYQRLRKMAIDEQEYLSASLWIHSYFAKPEGSYDRLKAIGIFYAADLADILLRGREGTAEEVHYDRADFYRDNTKPGVHSEIEYTEFLVISSYTFDRWGYLARWIFFDI